MRWEPTATKCSVTAEILLTLCQNYLPDANRLRVIFSCGVLCYDQQTCSRQHAVWWSNHSTSSAVMGKSQSHLGFKSRFEHIWRFDFNNKDSTQKITILLRFDWNLWFIWKKRLKAWQISCLLTDVKRNAQITETLLLQMMLKLHCTNWLMLQVLWLYEIYHVWLGLK